MNIDFIKAAGERAVKTFAQSFLALIGTGTVGLTHLSWQTDLGVAGTAALASALTSVASLSPITPGITSGAATEPTPAPGVTVPDVMPAIIQNITAPAKAFPAAAVAAVSAPVEPVAPVTVTPVYEAPAPAPAPAEPAPAVEPAPAAPGLAPAPAA